MTLGTQRGSAGLKEGGSSATSPSAAAPLTPDSTAPGATLASIRPESAHGQSGAVNDLHPEGADAPRTESRGAGSNRPRPAALNTREALLLSILQRRAVGPKNAVPQEELAELVGYRTGKPTTRCRKVQKLIDCVRSKRRVPIFTSCKEPMGVFIATCPEDTKDYFRRMSRRAVSELVKIKDQKAIVADAFGSPQARLWPRDPDQSASGLSGGLTGESEASRYPENWRPCKCGCGTWFDPGPYHREYVVDEHKKRHEATFYRIGRAVVEAGLEEVFAR